MIDTALYFLRRTALRIPQNLYAKAIYNSFRNAGNDVYLDDQNLLAIPFDNETVLDGNNLVNIERNKDYRFLYLYLKSFRKFPLIDDYYGISYCRVVIDKGYKFIPENTLLQGANGSGKTSVFGAMEYLFTGKISAAEKQKQETKDYIPYAGKTAEDVDINVVTKSYFFGLKSKNSHQQDFQGLCLLPFFCSEYDVDKVIGKGIDAFVYEQMGYTLIRGIIKKIDDELDLADNQYKEIGKSLLDIESRIAELDKEIGTYEKLWLPFLSLLVKMSNLPNAKNEIQSLKELLSKEFVQPIESDVSEKEILLTRDNLDEEIRKICKIFGKKAYSKYFELEYSKLQESIKEESEIKNPLIGSVINKNDNFIEALENLNRTRRGCVTILNKFMEDKVLSDTTLAIEWYDGLLKDLKEERQQAEDKKQRYNVVNRIVSQKKEYSDFLNILKTEVYDVINTLTSISRELVNDVMNLFLMADEEMSMDFNKNTGDFKMNITLKANGNPIPFTPEKYLNTFRYKLFCMTLKMAIAFSMKKFYRINFPIVIDDVFYSSDFDHRCKVRDFFRLLFDKHKKLFPEEDLQVIFLTHDDVVMDAAYHGIADVIGCSDVNRQIMFDHREALELSSEKLPFKLKDGNQETMNMKKITIS